SAPCATTWVSRSSLILMNCHIWASVRSEHSGSSGPGSPAMTWSTFSKKNSPPRNHIVSAMPPHRRTNSSAITAFIRAELLGHQNSAGACQAAVIQILHRIDRGIERILLGAHVDFARSIERHQLHKIVIGPHQIADHIDFARNNVNRVQLHSSAVTDHIMRSTWTQ